MNAALIQDPSAAEIKEAIFAIHPDKAPGPDGFSAMFFPGQLGSGWSGGYQRSPRFLLHGSYSAYTKRYTR